MTSTNTAPAAQDGTWPGIEVTTAGLTALARHASTVNDQMAALSVRAIAAAVRAALPAAAAVGLAWTGRGPSLAAAATPPPPASASAPAPATTRQPPGSPPPSGTGAAT